MRKTVAPPPAPSQLSLLSVAPSASAKKPAAVRKPSGVSPVAVPKVAAPPVKKSPVKIAPVKVSARRPVKVMEKATDRGKRAAKETPMRVTLEPMQAMTAGAAVWKMSGRHGVAYVRDAGLAGELLGVEPRKLAAAAMAVYCDKKGRAFAWQVRFDAARWDELCRRLA